jgi:PBSX family phage terminase large subunit
LILNIEEELNTDNIKPKQGEVCLIRTGQDGTTYKLLLTKKQQSFTNWTFPYKYRYWQGGFGAKKSTTICAAAIELCMRFPKNRWILARKTFEDVKNTTMDAFKDICPTAIIVGYNKRDGIHTFVNGSEVHWTGCEDWEKFKSWNIGGFGLDEASQVSEKAFDVLVSRVGRVSGVPSQACFGLLASNPPNADHWLHRRFVEDNNPLFMMMKSSSRENRQWLPPGYVENLERTYSYDPSLVEVLIDGEFGFTMGGQRVFPEFNANTHVRRCNYVPGKPIYRTWDFGFHHPAVLYSQIDEDGRIRHLNENMGKHLYFPLYRDQVIQQSNILYQESNFIDYCDDSGNNKAGNAEKTYIEWLREVGITPRHKRIVFEQARDIVAQKLCTYMSDEPMLVVDPACQVLIEGMKGGFRFPEAKGDRGTADYPLQDGYYEHLCDCNLILHANLYNANTVQKPFQQPRYARSYGNYVGGHIPYG